MKVGFYLPETGPAAEPESLVRLSLAAEKWGYTCAVVGDHIVVPEEILSRYPYTMDGVNATFHSGEYLEQLSVISFLLGATVQLTLVASVMVIPHRPAVLAAKMLATMDALSRGRVILGAGIGWNRNEFEILGVGPFDRRGSVTDEYIEAFLELWGNERPSFDGEFVAFDGFRFAPRPKGGRIPIWIGGNSTAAIRRAARFGDAWHPVGGIPTAPLEPQEIAENVRELARLASAYERQPGRVEVALKVPRYDEDETSIAGKRRRFVGSEEEVRSDGDAYEQVGVDWLIVDARAESESESHEWLAFYARALNLGQPDTVS